MKRLFVTLALVLLTHAQELTLPKATLPNNRDSFHFAVIGDTGTGGSAQYKISELMASVRKTFSYDTVLMLGDNLYGREDYKKKFEQPYAALLNDGVKFYASLGNHDSPNQRFYKNFNMDGKRFYSFEPRDGIRFFALDSNHMDREQLDWLDKELAASKENWKIAFFHHPPYSSGETHGSSKTLRNLLEPMFLKYGVSLVLSGHEHFYERIKPQHGIPYFIVGSSAKLRKGDIHTDSLTAKGFDTDNVFMICEIRENTLYFQVISKAGKTVDSGEIERPVTPAKAAVAK